MYLSSSCIGIHYALSAQATRVAVSVSLLLQLLLLVLLSFVVVSCLCAHVTVTRTSQYSNTCVTLGGRERDQREACLNLCLLKINYISQNRNRNKTEARHTGGLKEIVRFQSCLRRSWYLFYSVPFTILCFCSVSTLFLFCLCSVSVLTRFCMRFLMEKFLLPRQQYAGQKIKRILLHDQNRGRRINPC